MGLFSLFGLVQEGSDLKEVRRLFCQTMISDTRVIWRLEWKFASRNESDRCFLASGFIF